MSLCVQCVAFCLPCACAPHKPLHFAFTPPAKKNPLTGIRTGVTSTYRQRIGFFCSCSQQREEDQVVSLREVSASSPRQVFVVNVRTHRVQQQRKTEEPQFIAEQVSGVAQSSRWESLKELLLPVGYPESVAPGYIDFVFWNGARTLCGWIFSVLATQALLFAVGVGSGSLPLSAAWNWVLKDGLGLVSKLLFGSRFASSFDYEPKRWRTFADILLTFGSLLEILTMVWPSQFLLLASLGNVAKASADAGTGAAYRVFLNSFAVSNNIGDVSAKAESQIVAMNVLGLLLGVATSAALGSSTLAMLTAYSVLAGVHIYCTGRAALAVRLPTLNWQRLNRLLYTYVRDPAVIPSVDQVNRAESLWPFAAARLVDINSRLAHVLSCPLFLTDAQFLPSSSFLVGIQPVSAITPRATAPRLTSPPPPTPLPTLAQERPKLFGLAGGPGRGRPDVGGEWEAKVCVREGAGDRELLGACLMAHMLLHAVASGDLAGGLAVPARAHCMANGHDALGAPASGHRSHSRAGGDFQQLRNLAAHVGSGGGGGRVAAGWNDRFGVVVQWQDEGSAEGEQAGACGAGGAADREWLCGALVSEAGSSGVGGEQVKEGGHLGGEWEELRERWTEDAERLWGGLDAAGWSTEQLMFKAPVERFAV